MYHHFPTYDRAASLLRRSRGVLRKTLAGGLAAFTLGAAVPSAQALLELPLNYPPILNLQASPLVVEATCPAGACVTFDVNASDPGDLLPPVLSAAPASGSTFGLGETTVRVSALDLGGLLSLGSFVVRVQDTTAPVIYLNGAPDITVAADSDFNDDGAWAYDAVDEGISASVTGYVDIHTPGSYTLTYSATDFSGNSATPVTQTVHVVDPVLGLKRGRYHGGNISGHGDFNVAARNRVTAALFLEGQVYRAAFALTNPEQTVLFRAAANRTLSANIAIQVNERGESLLSVHTPVAMFELRPALYGQQKPAPASIAGTYNAVFRSGAPAPSLVGATPPPRGHGFVTLTVARDGSVRAVGNTAEGTPLTAAGCLVRTTDGSNEPRLAASPPPAQFHLHTGLYAATKRGNFGGVFTLDRLAANGSISGNFSWLAPEGALALYPEGLHAFGEIVGSRYERALPSGPISLRFDFNDDYSFAASGTVKIAPEGFDVSTPSHVRNSRTVELRCRFAPHSGVLVGSRSRGLGARTFKAVWLQEQSTIEGFSLSHDARSHGAVEGVGDYTK